MSPKRPKQRALLYALDALNANTLVTVFLRSGEQLKGYISGVGEHDLVRLFDQPAAVTPDGKLWVIDGCDIVAYRVEGA